MIIVDEQIGLFIVDHIDRFKKSMEILAPSM
jgi:hypothetical protein